MAIPTYQMLILEPTFLGRSRLEGILRSAAPSATIDSVATVPQLREKIGARAWDIVFFDPLAEAEPLWELLREVPRSFLVAIGGATTEVALHRLADARVSYFISRPYPPSKILACLDAFGDSTSTYFGLITQARELFESGELQSAQERLEAAVKLRKTPFEAWFYLARIARREGRFSEAAQWLERCLEADPSNFDCLCESFEVFMALKDFPRAFRRGKGLLWNFQSPPGIISRTLRLAVHLSAFDEIFQLESVASAQDDEDVTNHLGSALYVSGKHYLLSGRTPEALRCFGLLAPHGERYPKFLRATIFVLVRFGLRAEAVEFLSRMKAHETESIEVCNFITSDASSDPEGHRLQGRELLARYGGEDLREYLERFESGTSPTRTLK